jgi:hypothetical protein
MPEEGTASEPTPKARSAPVAKPQASGAEAPPPTEPTPRERRAPVPTLLDFYPLEDAKFTEIHAFFDELKRGRFTTTRCPRDNKLLWPPRLVCPVCHSDSLDWVELPVRGRVYAFSAVLVGAPMGMEADVPYVVGLVDLEGVPVRLFGRIEGAPWDALQIGQPVRLTPWTLDDGRVFFRFHTESLPAPNSVR